jgi:hypothetical protein
VTRASPLCDAVVERMKASPTRCARRRRGLACCAPCPFARQALARPRSCDLLPGYAIERRGRPARLKARPARWCLGVAFWEVWFFALAV